MNNKIDRIKELIKICNEASIAYYTLDKPVMSDKTYDAYYDELLQLESTTGVILSNSPTQRVQGEVLPFLTKVTHTEPMLSAEKSKDINDVIKFMGNKSCLLSWKLDGLTIVLRYNEGKLQQAITRGGGIEGEDVTHTVKTFTNVPLTIDYKGYLEIRGEGLVTFKDFERINAELIAKGEEAYSSPRNLAAGSVRQLDANITKARNLIFIAFGIVKCDREFIHKVFQFEFLCELGFQVVDHILTNKNMLRKY
jgi:DNA ligase (NAD+)